MTLEEKRKKELIEATWKKANFADQNIKTNNTAKDYAGAIIQKDAYGKKTEYGWEINYVVPAKETAHFNSDINICPAHWANVESKGQNFPEWETHLSTIDNVSNVKVTKKWRCVNGIIYSDDK